MHVSMHAPTMHVRAHACVCVCVRGVCVKEKWNACERECLCDGGLAEQAKSCREHA